jgi:hypothetical protein
MDIGDYPCFMRNALSNITIRAQLRHRDALAYAPARPRRAAEDSSADYGHGPTDSSEHRKTELQQNSLTLSKRYPHGPAGSRTAGSAPLTELIVSIPTNAAMGRDRIWRGYQ